MLSAMPESLVSLVTATAVFLSLHLIPSTPLRAALVKQLGEGGYLAFFSVASAAGLIWMAWSYGQAPQTPLWPPGPLRHLPLAVMPFAMMLLICGYTTRNPMVVKQERYIEARDPAPGILKVTRHPIMWAIALWAIAHLIAKGDAASLIFFGGLAALALAGMALMDHRKAEALGAAWGPFALTTSTIPFAAAIQGRAKPRLKEIGWWRIALGLAIFAVLLFLHEPLIGAPPF
jgi:uncharacterized membrane protein